MSRRSVATEVAQTMKIVRVTATPLNIPLQISLPGIERKSSLEGCFVEVETDIGIVGHGLAAITRETVIAEIVNGVIAPAIKGDDPLASEAIWDKLYWTLTPRGQTGFGMQALSAVDIALWDIKARLSGSRCGGSSVGPVRACRCTPRSASTSSTVISSRRPRSSGYRRATGV